MSIVQSENQREQRENGGGVQVIARAAKILRTLAGHSDGLSLAQIAREVGLARSTVYRIVTALEAEYFTTTAIPNGRIYLGPGLAPLAAAARHELHSSLEQLAKEVGETVDLSVLKDDQVVFIDQVTASSRRLRAISAIGATFPLHCTANGKALLAELPLEQIERLLSKHLEAFTENTLTKHEQLLPELKRIHLEQIAYDREEHTQGICAVGSVIPYTKNSMAAITIVLPSVRFYGNEHYLASKLLHTCQQIKQN